MNCGYRAQENQFLLCLKIETQLLVVTKTTFCAHNIYKSKFTLYYPKKGKFTSF